MCRLRKLGEIYGWAKQRQQPARRNHGISAHAFWAKKWTDGDLAKAFLKANLAEFSSFGW